MIQNKKLLQNKIKCHIYLQKLIKQEIIIKKLEKMKRIKIFYSEYIYELENEINNFMREHIVINVSLSTDVVGYDANYICLVLYEV